MELILPSELMDDPISIGALHASLKGVSVVHAAGNSGSKGSTSSVVPWIFSVAASSTDRGIITIVVLENGTILTVCIINSNISSSSLFPYNNILEHMLLQGKGVNTFSLNQTSYPLVSGEDASVECDKDLAK